MISLAEMPTERFDAWRAATVTRLADLRAGSGLRPPAEAAEQAEAIVARRFPDGAGAAGQHVLEIRDGERVAGSAWLEVTETSPHAMLFMLDADDAAAAAALPLIEERARELGAGLLKIDLFVQDHAGWAAAEGRGYRPTNVQMLLSPLPAPRASGAVVLTRMTPEQYAEFDERVIREFAEDLVNEGLHTPEAALEESAKEQAAALPDGLETEGELVLAATAGGERVGTLWLEVRQRSTGPHVFVMELHVEPEHRRRGFGAEIMRAGEDEARRVGADSIGLHVFGSNAAARGLYRGLGYREIETLLATDL